MPSVVRSVLTIVTITSAQRRVTSNAFQAQQIQATERSFTASAPRFDAMDRLLVRAEIFGNHTSVFPLHFESNSARLCIQSGNEIAVASDALNGTFLTSLSLLYEYASSFLFSLDHDRRLLVDNRLGAKPAEHDAATAFSDHE